MGKERGKRALNAKRQEGIPEPDEGPQREEPEAGPEPSDAKRQGSQELSALQRLQKARGLSSTPVKQQRPQRPRIRRERSEREGVPPSSARRKDYYVEGAVLLGADEVPADLAGVVPKPEAPQERREEAPRGLKRKRGDMVVIHADGAMELPPEPETPEREAQSQKSEKPQSHKATESQRQPESQAPEEPVERRRGMTWDTGRTHATITRRRRIEGQSYQSVVGTVAFMVQELFEELSALERNHEYEFRLDIKQLPDPEPDGTEAEKVTGEERSSGDAPDGDHNHRSAGEDQNDPEADRQET